MEILKPNNIYNIQNIKIFIIKIKYVCATEAGWWYFTALVNNIYSAI